MNILLSNEYFGGVKEFSLRKGNPLDNVENPVENVENLTKNRRFFRLAVENL